jgi:hypothetical protein
VPFFPLQMSCGRSGKRPETDHLSQLMLFKQITVINCETHIKHLNTQCGMKDKTFSVKIDGMYSDSWMWHC